MSFTSRSALSTLALTLALASSAQAYTILLQDDYNGGEYGSIWGKCQDGTEFEVRWLTEDSSVTYSIDTTTGDDQFDLIQDFCANHGG